MSHASPHPPAMPVPEQDPRFSEIWRRLDKLESTIFYGNGQPPLTARIASLERSAATQTWLLRTVLGVVVSNLAALAFLAFR